MLARATSSVRQRYTTGNDSGGFQRPPRSAAKRPSSGSSQSGSATRRYGPSRLIVLNARQTGRGACALASTRPVERAPDLGLQPVLAVPLDHLEHREPAVGIRRPARDPRDALGLEAMAE